MAVENRIVKVQKRNRALVRFTQEHIWRAILRAAESIGGFEQDYLPGVNDTIFKSHHSDNAIATFLSDAVVVCLNSNPHHLIANFPPTIETIQDEVLHALRSYGFQNTADAYACYRWGRHWLREGAITKEQLRRQRLSRTRRWSRRWSGTVRAACDTVAGLNESCEAESSKRIVEESLARL